MLTRGELPAAVLDLVVGHLERSGYTVTDTDGLYIFGILRRVLAAAERGAQIPVSLFPKPVKASAWLRRLEDAGFIYCSDPFSWIAPVGVDGKRDIRNVRPREYRINSFELVKAYSGSTVTTFAEWKETRGSRRQRTAGKAAGRVIIDPGSGVPIPAAIIEAFKSGSGLRFDRRYLAQLRLTPGELQATVSAIGYYDGEIKPDARQIESGRLYARDPSLYVLPRPARSRLVSTEGRQLYSVDYRAQEPTIFCLQAGVKPPAVGVYEWIAAACGGELTVQEVKEVFLPMIYGIRRNEFYCRRPTWRRDQEVFDRITKALRRPGQMNRLLDRLQAVQESRAAGRADLSVQRTGAQIFTKALSGCLEVCGSKAGSLLFDGWIFAPPSEAGAGRVKTIFEDAGEEVTGYRIPAKLSKLAAVH